MALARRWHWAMGLAVSAAIAAGAEAMHRRRQISYGPALSGSSLEFPARTSLGVVVVVVAVAVLVLLAAMACSSDEPTAVPTIDLADIVVEDVPTQPAATVPAASRNAAKVLQIEVAECGIFDPAVDYSDSGWVWIMATVHEIHAGLVRVSGESPPTIDLALAGRHEVSEDRVRHEFELRPGLRFSDGSPVLASDVVWSWERALRKSTPPSEARDIFGSVAGVDEYLAGTSTGVSGLAVIDDRRLSVELKVPDPVLLYRLARPAAFVLSEADATLWDGVYINDEEFPRNSLVVLELGHDSLPIGAGPFRLAEYADPGSSYDQDSTGPTGDRCVLLPNPHHWDQSVPMLDAVVANVVPGLASDFRSVMPSQASRFISGEVDFADAEVIFEFEATDSDVAFEEVSTASELFYRFLIFNPELAPFDDLEVRRALVRAAPSIYEYDPEYTDYRTQRLIPEILVPQGTEPASPAWLTAELDAATAARLRGVEIPVLGWWRNFEVWVDMAFAAWADELGVDTVSSGRGEFEEHTRPPAERALDLFSLATTSPLPGAALRVALESFGTEDPPAIFARLKDALSQAELEVDLAVRLERLVAIEAELIDQALVLPIRAEALGGGAALQPWVNGLEFAPFGGSRFAGVWLSDDAPERVVPEGAP